MEMYVGRSHFNSLRMEIFVKNVSIKSSLLSRNRMWKGMGA